MMCPVCGMHNDEHQSYCQFAPKYGTTTGNIGLSQEDIDFALKNKLPEKAAEWRKTRKNKSEEP